MKMQETKNEIFTVGKFTKEYKKQTGCKYTDYQINQFLKNLYDELLDEIILNGYELEIGRMFNMTFRRFERNFDKLAVNWGESNKIKRRLIAEGKKLATKIGTSDSGNPIFDDGEMWLVYYTDAYYVSSAFKAKKYLNPETNKYESYKLRFIWDIEQHSKLLARFSNYERQGKIKKTDIELHYGSKNNIL
jgi:hypothetical protein